MSLSLGVKIGIGAKAAAAVVLPIAAGAVGGTLLANSRRESIAASRPDVSGASVPGVLAGVTILGSMAALGARGPGLVGPGTAAMIGLAGLGLLGAAFVAESTH